MHCTHANTYTYTMYRMKLIKGPTKRPPQAGRRTTVADGCRLTHSWTPTHFRP